MKHALLWAYAIGAATLADAQIPYLTSRAPAPFVPIAAGTPIDFAFDGDDGARTVEIGFDFEYFGETYRFVNVGVNGVMNLARACGSGCPLDELCGRGVCERNVFAYDARALPPPSGPTRVLAPFWDDFVLRRGVILVERRGVAPRRELVIEWRDVSHYDDPTTTLRFQAQLLEGTNEVFFNYGAITLGARAAFSGLVGITGPNEADVVLPLDCGEDTASVCALAELSDLADQRLSFAQLRAPDLLGAVFGPPRVVRGRPFAVEISARNAGTEATPIPFAARLLLSRDELLSADDIDLGPVRFGRLNAFAAARRVQTATLSADFAPGRYFFIAELDSDDAITEPVELNNVATATAAVLIGPELTVRLRSVTPAEPGETMRPSFELSALNEAVAAAPWSLYLSRDDQFDGADVRLAGGERALSEASTVTLAPEILVPAAPAGRYSVIAVIDPGDLIAEADETNNVAVSAPVPIGPDLSGAIRRLAPSGGAGEPFRLEFRVGHVGRALVRAPYAVYFSADRILDPADLRVAAGELALRETVEETFVIEPVLPATPPGEYFVVLVLDPEGRIPEADESNNEVVSTSRVRLLGPDLVATRLEVPSVFFRGETTLVGLELANQGGSTSGVFSVGLYFSDNPLITLTDREVATLGPLTLARNGRATYWVPVTLEAAVPAGVFQFGVLVDPENAAGESDELNNVRRHLEPVTVRDPAPDLRVLDVRIPAVAVAGRTLLVDRTFENAGRRAAKSVAEYRLAPEDADPAAGLVLGQAAVTLEPGALDRGADRLTLPGSLLPGNYLLQVALDPARTLDDLAYDDNVKLAAGALRIEAGGLAFSTTSLPPATVGVRYLAQLGAVGGSQNYVFALREGRLPEGLVLDPQGQIAGTAQRPESTQFAVMLSDGQRQVERTFTLFAGDPSIRVRLVTRALPTAWVGQLYVFPLTALGGAGELHFTISSGRLPPGFQLEGNELRGLTSAATTALFNVRVTDGSGDFDERPILLHVLGPSEGVRLRPDAPPSAVVGRTYDHLVRADFGLAPYRFDRPSGPLPPGLRLVDDRLTGTPTVAGSYFPELRVTDARGDFDREAFLIEVEPEGSLRFLSASLPRGVLGAAYLDPEGVPVLLRASAPVGRAVRFALVNGALPAGLVLEPDGRLVGTPSETGVFPLLVEARDDQNRSDLRALGLVIDGESSAEPEDDGCSCTSTQRPSLSSLAGLLFAFFVLRGRRNAAVVALALFVLPAHAVPYVVTEDAPAYTPLSAASAVRFSGTDDGVATIGLPFAFRFFDQNVRQVLLSTNGYLTFDAAGAEYANQSIPDPAPPNGYIAPFWDDLQVPSLSSGGFEIRGSAPNRVAIFELRDLRRVGQDEDRFSAQIWLYEGPQSRFDIHYGPASLALDPSHFYGGTIGFEAPDGRSGTNLGACPSGVCDRDDLAALAGRRLRVEQDGGTELVARSIQGPAEAEPAVPFVVTVELASAHRASLGPARYAIFVGTEGERRPSRRLWLSAPVTLTPFQVLRAEAQVVVPETLPPGRYRLFLQADAEDAIVEPDEEDNWIASAAELLVFAARPNLRVRAVTASVSAARPGEPLRVQAQVANDGTVDAETSWSLTLAESPHIGPDGAELARGRVRLPAAGTATLAIDTTLPAELSPGRYWVGLWLDPEDAVPERSELDNGARATTPVALIASALTFRTRALPPAVVEGAYAAQLSASGGDGSYLFSRIGGLLPRGLSLSPTGRIAGRPEVTGREEITFEVTSAGATARATLTLEVVALTGPLTIVTRELPPGILGQAYPPLELEGLGRLVAVGGNEAARFRSIEPLPIGLSLDEDGTLRGTPVSAGVFALDVAADAGTETATASVILPVLEPGRLMLLPGVLPGAIVGEPYAHRFVVLGASGTATVSFRRVQGGGDLPPGLELSPSGELAGLPAQVGRSSFVIEARDGLGGASDRARFELAVRGEASFGIEPNALPPAQVGVDYEAVLAPRRGQAPFVWRVFVADELPAGLGYEVRAQADREVLRFSGRPTEPPRGPNGEDIGGVSSVLVELEDAAGRVSRAPFVLRVVPAPGGTTDDSGCGCQSTRRPLGGTDAGVGLILLSLLAALRGRLRAMRRALLLLGLALVGCEGDRVTEVRPSLAAEPERLDFGTLGLSAQRSLPLTIRNNAPSPTRLTVTVEDNCGGCFLAAPLPSDIPGPGQRDLEVRFRAVRLGTITGTLTIRTPFADVAPIEVPLTGRGEAGPEPDVEARPPSVEFGRVPAGGIALGGFDLASIGNADLVVDRIYIDPPTAPFRISTSTPTLARPGILPPGESAQVRVEARFSAAQTGTVTAQVLIDTNLLREKNVPGVPGRLAVPLSGNGNRPPVAVIRAPARIAPYTRVDLDGSESADPDGLPGEPLEFRWSLSESPGGSTALLERTGGTAPTFFADLAGRYEVSLIVVDALGLASAPARARIDALPPNRIHIELFWDHPDADVDLHVIREGGAFCDCATDVHYRDCGRAPDWFPEAPGANPRLDVDDRQGFGPETVNFDGDGAARDIPAGRYRVAAHYYATNSGVSSWPTETSNVTVRIYLDGQLSGEFTRPLVAAGDLWYAAEIRWPERSVSEGTQLDRGQVCSRS